MERKEVILKLLFEKRQLHFRAIVDESQLGNPTVVKRELDALRKKRLISKDPWLKHGKKVFYHITPRGSAEYIRIAFDAVNKALKNVKEISDAILSDPKKLAEWKRMSREYFDTTETSQEKYKIYEPLHESYKNLHVIIHLLSLPPILHNVPMFIGMDKGSLCLIPNQVLEDTGLLGPVTLRLKPSMFNQEHRHPAES